MSEPSNGHNSIDFSRPDWRILVNERDAQSKSDTHQQAKRRTFKRALNHARMGWLAPDWRHQGLEAASAAWRPGLVNDDYFVWLDVNETCAGRIWEPLVRERGGYSWRHALESWWIDSRVWWREDEAASPKSVSSWAGLNVVDATLEQWESLLDNHSGPWPDQLASASTQHWASMGFRAQIEKMQIDRLCALYEGGLARGGVDIDWIGRHRERVNRWRVARQREDLLARLNSCEPAKFLEHRLPAYWGPS